MSDFCFILWEVPYRVWSLVPSLSRLLRFLLRVPYQFVLRIVGYAESSFHSVLYLPGFKISHSTVILLTHLKSPVFYKNCALFCFSDNQKEIPVFLNNPGLNTVPYRNIRFQFCVSYLIPVYMCRIFQCSIYLVENASCLLINKEKLTRSRFSSVC